MLQKSSQSLAIGLACLLIDSCLSYTLISEAPVRHSLMQESTVLLSEWFVDGNLRACCCVFNRMDSMGRGLQKEGGKKNLLKY